MRSQKILFLGLFAFFGFLFAVLPFPAFDSGAGEFALGVIGFYFTHELLGG